MTAATTPWQTQLSALVEDPVPELPSTAVGRLIELGIWTGTQALARTRRDRGDWPSDTLAAIAPALAHKHIEDLLAEKHVHPLYPRLSSRRGLVALLRRLADLAGHSHALAAHRRLPDVLRALLAPIAVSLAQQLPDCKDTIRGIITHAIRHAGAIDVCDSADVMLELLPHTDRATQLAIVDQAIERIYDEDFPITPSQWRQIASVDEPRARAAAQRERLPYPRAWLLSAVSFHQRGSARHHTLVAWLDACRQLLANGFAMRGNDLPRPLPGELLVATLNMVERAGPDDLPYVLCVMSEHHPELAKDACHSLRQLSPIHRALAWVVFGPSLQARTLAQPEQTRAAVLTLHQHLGTSLFNQQRAWTGWYADTFSTAEWCARAIAMLPAAEVGPQLAELLRALSL